jgi:hypothetical protein
MEVAMAKKSDIVKLERGIKALDLSLKKLNKKQSLNELINIIHGPGWTTLAEILFLQGAIDSLINQSESIQTLTDAVLKGSRAVGQK